MKNLLTILAALALGVIHLAAQPAVLSNGQWTIITDAGTNSTGGRAGGGAINTNFSFLFTAVTNPVATGWTNVHVALRADGRDGAGTITDPRDGSTAAKFSAIYSNVVDGTLLKLGPGAFTLYGSFNSGGNAGLRPRLKIEGAGEHLTTIQADTNFIAGWAQWSGNTAYGLLCMESDGNSQLFPGAVLRDLTLDVRWHLMPETRTNYTFNAVNWWGDGGLVENVTIKNTADKQGDNAESFPIYMAGTNWVARRVTVKEHWSATNGFPNNNTGHTLFGGTGKGVFEDCVADLRSVQHGANSIGYSHGFSIESQVRIERGTVYGRADGGTQGAYADTGTVTGSSIANTLFENVNHGAVINGVPLTNFSFTGNTVNISTNPLGAGIYNNTGGVEWSGIKVIGNTFRSRNNSPAGHYGILAPATWLASDLYANTFQAGLSNRLGGAHTNLTLLGNRLTDGGYPTNAATGESLAFTVPVLKYAANGWLWFADATAFKTGNYGPNFNLGFLSDVGAALEVSAGGNVGNSPSAFIGTGTVGGTNVQGLWLDGGNATVATPHLNVLFGSGAGAITSRTFKVQMATNSSQPSAGPVAAEFRGDGYLTVTNLGARSAWLSATNHASAIRLRADESIGWWPVIRTPSSGSARGFVTVGRQDVAASVHYTADGYNGTYIKRFVAAGGYWGWTTSSTDASGIEAATMRSGAGSPEGVVTANVGSIFLRTDGGAGSTFYVKETGAGNTGWSAK